MEIPTVNLKTILLVHWLLTCWGCLVAWLPSAYAWSNFTVLAMGVWAVAQRDSVDAIIMFLVGMIITFVTDIIDFGIYYPVGEVVFTGWQRDSFRFSVGMAILSLILKPLSCFCAYQMYRERGGDYAVNFGFPTVTSNRNTYQSLEQNRSTYQSIDRQDSPVNPHLYNEQDNKAPVRI
ncbi:type-1 angiotensin II receptor-associated protein [Protopterus annectens]|uniref:type-1 angiotensin II receptor-associated protein n=1 Tax=Protopterus annectens TaxID=7888 RepID=UPI001CF9F225|nr:type-1 angiotensin II receptor-associated protein [Protopterus annectens]